MGQLMAPLSGLCGCEAKKQCVEKAMRGDAEEATVAMSSLLLLLPFNSRDSCGQWSQFPFHPPISLSVSPWLGLLVPNVVADHVLWTPAASLSAASSDCLDVRVRAPWMHVSRYGSILCVSPNPQARPVTAPLAVRVLDVVFRCGCVLMNSLISHCVQGWPPPILQALPSGSVWH